uniref:Uncharacterized protein n=1 Tax=Anguilla anguilla TaxID=7936 RepID=A0A0E9W6I3_ANGAN
MLHCSIHQHTDPGQRGKTVRIPTFVSPVASSVFR